MIRRGALLLTFYGDDFTGSTDALEAVAVAGLPTMLFLAPPTPEQVARHPGLAAVGVAGTSRSRSPEWMSAELPEVFSRLKALGAPFCHYKTCSTFDSSPGIGSIGRAAEIGQDVFGGPVLMVVGVPRLKRFVVFSNLFAAAAVSDPNAVFRIDRHPTMSRHPVTPMAEADLCRHLALQTGRKVEGFSFLQMLAGNAEQALDGLARAGADIIVLDGFDAATTSAAGMLMASRAGKGQIFVAGSSGVEYALVQHLRETGALSPRPAPSPAGPADKLVAVCGSCSPVSEAQIAWATANGFKEIAVDTVAAVAGDADALAAVVAADAAGALADHRGVVIHTARGPGDPRVAPTRKALEDRGLSGTDSARILGGLLGRAARTVMAEAKVRRAVLAGGDSSGYAVQAMGIEALEMSAPFVPGAPFCRIHSADPAIAGAEIVLKGGQVGSEAFFAHVLQGNANAQPCGVP